MKKAEYMEAKEHEKDAKKKLDEAAKTLSDLKEPIEKQKQEKTVLDAKCKKAGRLVNENSKRLTELMSNESPLGVQDNLKAQILELEVSANNKINQKSEKERLLVQKKMSLRNFLDREGKTFRSKENEPQEFPRQMPTTIEELEAAIQDNISQASSMLFLNNNILEEYEHRKNQLEDLAKILKQITRI
nr:structural maintenance of chromosomes protein 5 [Quercus suber]